MKIKGNIHGSWSNGADDDIWHKNKDIFLKQKLVSHSSIISAIIERAKTTKSKILEFGCGSGNYAISLANLGYNVVATDYEQSAIELTKARAGRHLPDHKLNNITYMTLDAQEMSLPNESYDLIYNVGAIEHLDIMRVLKECCRVLTKGGWMISAVPFFSLRWDIFWKLSCYMSKGCPYTQFLTKEEWKDMYKNLFNNVQVAPSSFILEAVAMRIFGPKLIYHKIFPNILNTEIIVMGEKT